jgi:tetratricopeptide (TPR) repeat protein
VPVSKNRRKNGKKAATANSPEPRDPMLDAISNPALAREASIAGMAALQKLMGNVPRGLAIHDLWDDDDDDGSADPLFAAQELIYEAWEAGTRRERVALARRALEASELCADAWVLLAGEAAKTGIEKRDLLEKAVAAREEAIRQTLGEDAFEEDEGDFWGILETRPYMRARAALADCLWEFGEREEAVAHWRDMLRLCPGDNLGIRHILGPRLLELNQLGTARDLLEEYEEPDFAEWGYSYALLQFKQGGATSGAAKALKAAIKNNPHVPHYLLGTKHLPKTLPPHYGLGSKEEAVLYAVNAVETWKTTRGALVWLDGIVKNTV